MKKVIKKLCIVLLIVLGTLVAAVAAINLYLIFSTPKENLIKTDNCFDYQAHFECSGYSSAYVLRSLGEEADGKDIYGSIDEKNSDQTVSPDVLVNYLNTKGYNAKLCSGSEYQLKNAVSRGVPVIVFVRVSPDASYYHYLPIVGYDETQYFAAESLRYMVNEENEYYNRSIANDDFANMWKTEISRNNLYITISK